MNEKTGTIEKPEIETITCYNWFDVCKYIEDKYQCNLRDYRGIGENKHTTNYETSAQNFFAYVSDYYNADTNSHGFFHISNDIADIYDCPDYAEEILKLIFAEFPADGDGYITLYT